MPVCTSHFPVPSRLTVTETEVSRVLREIVARRVQSVDRVWIDGSIDGICSEGGVGGAAHTEILE